MKLKNWVLLSASCLTLGSGVAQNTLSYTDIEQEYATGVELFEKHAYAAARKHFDNYLSVAQKQVAPNANRIANAAYYATVANLYLNAPEAPVEVERFVTNYASHPKAKVIYADLGEKYYANQNFEMAATYLEKAVAGRPISQETARLHYILGVSYLKLGQKDAALKLFNQVKATLTEQAIDAAYYAAVIAFEREDYDSALQDLRRVENAPAYKADIPNWIGQLLYKQKKYNELLTYANMVLANPNGRKVDELSLVAAEAAYFQDKFPLAADLYTKSRQVRKLPLDPQVTFRYGYSLYKLPDYKKATEVLKPIATSSTALGQQAAYYLGISALNSKDLPAATAAFRFAQSLNFDPEIREEATYNYTKALVEQGNYSEAMKQLASYVQQYPNGKYVDASNEILGDILYENNNYKTAIEYIEGLSRRTPKLQETYQKMTYNQGVLLFNNEKFQDAIVYFNKSLTSPASAALAQQVSFWKAEALYALGKAEAEELYRQLVASTNPEIRIKSKYSLGYLLYNKKEYTAATKYLEDFVNTTKGVDTFRARYEDALLRLGDLNLVQKNYPKAIQHFDEVLSTNSTEKDYALYQKGIALRFMDRNAEADRIFAQIATSFPESRLLDDALLQQANAQIENVNYQGAIQTLTELLRKRPNSSLLPQVLVKRGLAYANTKQNQQAIADYRIILKRFGQSEEAEEALIALKDIYAAMDREEEYLAVLEEFKRANPENSSVSNLAFDSAKSLFINGKYEQAVAAFKKLIQSNPGQPVAYESNFYLAESYAALKQLELAIQTYEEVIRENKPEFMPQAAFKVAGIYFQQKNYTKAIQNYQLNAEVTSNKKEQATSWEGIMNAYYASGQYQNAINQASNILSSAGSVVPGIQNRASLMIGKSQQGLNQLPAAIAQYEKTIGMATDQAAAEAAYRIGEIFYITKRYDESIKQLQKLGDTFSNFTEWYEKAYLLIARNYLAKGDTFMASATLTSLVENAESPAIVQEAKELLKSIK